MGGNDGKPASEMRFPNIFKDRFLLLSLCLASQAGCKDKDFIFELPNVFSSFFFVTETGEGRWSKMKKISISMVSSSGGEALSFERRDRFCGCKDKGFIC